MIIIISIIYVPTWFPSPHRSNDIGRDGTKETEGPPRRTLPRHLSAVKQPSESCVIAWMRCRLSFQVLKSANQRLKQDYPQTWTWRRWWATALPDTSSAFSPMALRSSRGDYQGGSRAVSKCFSNTFLIFLPPVVILSRSSALRTLFVSFCFRPWAVFLYANNGLAHKALYKVKWSSSTATVYA